MPSRTKPTTSEIVDANGIAPRANAPIGSRPRSRAGRQLGTREQNVYLDLLRSCADALLTRDADFQEVFAKLAPVLELDAFALYGAASGEQALTFETAVGLSNTAISGTVVAGMVAELERTGRRTLVLDALRYNADERAAVFRDLGLASVVVGALVVGERLLGAVVFAARSKERFSAAELMLLDAIVCCIAASYERRDLAGHRHSAEERKHEFLTVLAHELRNPLAPVRNALEIIRTNDRGRSPVEHSAYAMIDRQLQHIGRLADDLLDANQVVLGHLELAKQRVLLDAVVERAAEQSRPWVEAARHTLTLDLPREAVALDADPKRLARAFSNLVNNAARRIDRGGRIVVSAEAENGMIVVFVRARGRPVATESFSSVFADAVVDGGATEGQSQGGVTASMTLVKHLVEMHGGTVDARMTTDGAVEFAVHLPVVRAGASSSRKSKEAADDGAEHAVPHRILIADDNADSAESMGMLLRLMGNDVRIANDGLEAVEQAEEFQPDIVLMDIGMPRLDGYEAARRIRNQAWSRGTLLVAVTGWGPSDDSEEAAAAGFDHHFTKPLDPAELRRLVSGVRPH